MNDKDVSLLRKLYADIVRGSTISSYKNDKILIKHFTSLDQGLIDTEYEFYYTDAIDQGLPNSEQRLIDIIDQGIWLKSDEAWINSQKLYIENLYKTKSKISWQSQVDEMNKTISEAELALVKKTQDKQEAVGLVAETYASKKLNERYIYHSFRCMDNVEKHFFTNEFFDDLSAIDLNDLASLYNKILEPFQIKNLKRIGLAPFFQSVYSICDDNPHVFYGKAVCDLTYYQSEIFTYGRFFRSILTGEGKPDQEKLDDPDKLIDWYMSAKNAQQFVGNVDDDTNGATMVFNAKKSDIIAAGGKVAQSPVSRAIKEGKSTLNMDEVMKHHKA